MPLFRCRPQLTSACATRFRGPASLLSALAFVACLGCQDASHAAPPVASDQAQATSPQSPAPSPQPEFPVAVQNKDPFPQAGPAPALQGGVEWLNTAGPLDIKDLKGKFVLLDFWTYCCINCMHILPELKKLEKAYPNEIVVIGVHSAKFDNEKDTENIREAIQRYEIEHPVVNDANHAIWNRYNIQSWPSLRIIDPEGRLIAGHSGEIPFEALDEFFKKFIRYYERQGTLDRTPLRFALETEKLKPTPLRFPGKVLADGEGDRLFISDSNHNRIVVTRLDGSLLDVIGSGDIGAKNGAYDQASFNHPQGVAVKGNTLYVADTENHLIRKVDLSAKQVTTVAGTGKQGRGPWPGIKQGIAGATMPKRFVDSPKKTGLASPWALLIHGNNLYIAMAGPHQIWKMPLDESELGIYAGNGREDIVDGLLLPSQPYEAETQVDGELVSYSSFAQPSGLATDGKWLFVADSEGSSIRAVPLDGKGRVTTVLGTAGLPQARLFTFGDVDGDASKAMLQHCIGVAYDNNKLYVADTYNNKIKLIDDKTKLITTFAGTGKRGKGDSPAEFDEPAGVSVANGKLYVADTNNHAIRVVDLQTRQVSTLAIPGLKPPAPPRPETGVPSFPNASNEQAPLAKLKPANGQVQLAISLNLPTGWKLNDQAPMGYYVQLTGDSGPIDRKVAGTRQKLAAPATQFNVSLPVTANTGKETVKLAITYYYCQEGLEGLCKVGTVIWSVPIEVSEAGAAEGKLDYSIKP